MKKIQFFHPTLYVFKRSIFQIYRCLNKLILNQDTTKYYIIQIAFYINKMLKNVQKYGTNQLKNNLNEDISDGQFINQKFKRWIYCRITQYSSTVFSFALIYLASTHQLEKFDPFVLYKQTKNQTIFYIILALTFICYLEDKLLHQWSDKKEQNKKQQVNFLSRPKVKMILSCVFDVLRVVNYYLVYHLLNLEIFSKTDNSHLFVTKCSLLILWCLFLLRKAIFWFSILVAQHLDQRPWQQREAVTDDKLEKVYSEVQSKFGQITNIIKTLEGMKANNQNQKQKQKKNK